MPPPKVTSSVVSPDAAAGRPAPRRSAPLERVTAAAFGQRRKMLRGSLSGLVRRSDSGAGEASASSATRAPKSCRSTISSRLAGSLAAGLSAPSRSAFDEGLTGRTAARASAAPRSGWTSACVRLVVDIAVDDDVVVFGPMAHLVGGLGHALGDDLGAVLGARAQAPLELARSRAAG